MGTQKARERTQGKQGRKVKQRHRARRSRPRPGLASSSERTPRTTLRLSPDRGQQQRGVARDTVTRGQGSPQGPLACQGSKFLSASGPRAPVGQFPGQATQGQVSSGGQAWPPQLGPQPWTPASCPQAVLAPGLQCQALQPLGQSLAPSLGAWSPRAIALLACADGEPEDCTGEEACPSSRSKAAMAA